MDISGNSTISLIAVFDIVSPYLPSSLGLNPIDVVLTSVFIVTFAFIELKSSILAIVANLGRHITLFLLGLFASASSRFCNSINSF